LKLHAHLAQDVDFRFENVLFQPEGGMPRVSMPPSFCSFSNTVTV
jgi:hypothetical protein